MQASCLSPRNGPILKEDARSDESNEKSIFLFLFFELLLIVFTIYGWHTGIFKYVTNQKKKSFRSGHIYWKNV